MTVGLAGTLLSSNIYGTVVFDLTFFNEATKSDNIEVIIGLPDICMHRLIHRIPLYFDTPDPAYLDVQIHSKEESQKMKTQDQRLSIITNSSSLQRRSTAKCRGSLPCTNCSDFSSMGYDNTLCSMSGRPYTLPSKGGMDELCLRC